MSKWVEGKLELKCSINILKKAILKIMPQWEAYLQIDDTGQLEIYRYNKQRHEQGGKCHVLIPGGGNPKHKCPSNRNSDNDWGFKRNDDGTWSATFCDFNLSSARNLENQMKGEIAIMKAKAISRLRGHEILSEENDGDEHSITVRVDTEEFKKIRG